MATAAANCGKWQVPARIDGRSVCLREGRSCKASFRQQYERYGFVCQDGVLDVRWKYLRARPLDPRTVTPGDACPVTTQTGLPRGHSLPGLGPGPAYPIGTSPVITITLPPPENWGTEWSGTKRVWLVDSAYPGRILVRGRQLDGPGEVRFVLGRPGFTDLNRKNPVPELRIDAPLYDSLTPSLTRVRGPGCYAYQVDGRTFSYLIVFEARLAEGWLEPGRTLCERCAGAQTARLRAGPYANTSMRGGCRPTPATQSGAWNAHKASREKIPLPRAKNPLRQRSQAPRRRPGRAPGAATTSWIPHG